MNITVNGKRRKLNIGCRTFISVVELLRILEVKHDQPLTFSLNGEVVHWQKEPGAVVTNGDVVTVTGIPTATGLRA